MHGIRKLVQPSFHIQGRFREGSSVDEKRKFAIRRRDLLRIAASAGIATAAVGAASPSVGTTGQDRRGKRKSLYQGNSAEVQAFYRVNRYPVK
jgi:hypothetical protein